jgi:GrpB-like predicted nucleotidyltransferase (UPF0157 family)
LSDAGREFRGGLIRGPERADPIDIVPWNPDWPLMYEQMRDRLAAALGPLALRIEHVGSTAIAGIPAKPVIDIQVSVPDVDDTDAYRHQIESCGFGLRYITDGWRYFRPPPPLPRDYQVHVVERGSDQEGPRLLFRDFMRAHPGEAAEYGRLKMRIATRTVNDRIQYNDEKGPFILAVLDAAEEWARQTGWTPSPSGDRTSV